MGLDPPTRLETSPTVYKYLYSKLLPLKWQIAYVRQINNYVPDKWVSALATPRSAVVRTEFKSLRIIRSNRAATNLAAYILRSNFSGSSDGSTKQRKWKEKRSQGQDPKPTFVSHVNLALAVTACCHLYGTKLTSVSREHWPSFAAEADAKYDDNDEKSEDDGQRREEPDVKSIHLNNPANSHRFSLPTKVHVVYSTFFLYLLPVRLLYLRAIAKNEKQSI